MSIISKEAGVKLPEDIKRVYGFDLHSLAALGAKHPEDPQENLEFKKRLYYLLAAPVFELADERLKNLRQAKIDLKQGVTHAELSQELWDAEGHEHRLPPMNLLEEWNEQVEKIDKVTIVENNQGIDVEKKRHLFMDRKTHLWKQGLIRESRRMVDDYIWQEHREKFERFIIEGGVHYGEIEKEMEKEFLERYERESPMQGFVLGIGENNDLEKIYWRRRILVDEARDAIVQTIKKGEKEKVGSHFSNLKEYEQEGIKRLFDREDEKVKRLRSLVKSELDDLDFKGEIDNEAIEYLFENEESVQSLANKLHQQLGWDLNISEGRILKEMGKDFGNTGDLLKAIRRVYVWKTDPNGEKRFIEEGDMAKGLAREDKLFEKNDYNDLFDDAGESYLSENYRNQLNTRAGVMFGQEFTDLSGNEQKMVMVGTGEVLSHTEIMRWMLDWRTKDGHAIRISEEPNYGQWTYKGLVNKQGLWLLADMQSAMINSFGARPEIRSLEKRQIDSQRNQGMGKYRMYDTDLWQIFYGLRLRNLEPENKGESFNGYKDAEANGALVKVFKNMEGEVMWAGGLWPEWKKAKRAEYEEELETIAKYEKKTEKSWQRLDFEDWLWRKMGQRGFDSFAQEMYVSGWRLLAEKVFIQLRSDWIESEALLGLKPEDLSKALSGDRLGQKIGPYGEKILNELYLEETKGFLLSAVEWGWLNLRLGLVGKKQKEKIEYKKMVDKRKKAEYRIRRDFTKFTILTPIWKKQTVLGVLGMWSAVQALLYAGPNLPFVGGIIGLVVKEPMFTTFWVWPQITGLMVPALRLLITATLAGANAVIFKRLVLAKSRASGGDLSQREEMAEKYISAIADKNLRELIVQASTKGVNVDELRRGLEIISQHDKGKK